MIVSYFNNNRIQLHIILFLLLASTVIRYTISWQHPITTATVVIGDGKKRRYYKPNYFHQNQNRRHHYQRNLELYSEKKNQQQQQIRPGSLEAATAELGKVPYGESSRKYRRTIYKHDDWILHRSNDKILENLQSMFFSGVVRQVQNKIVVVCGLSLFLIIWNDYLMPYYETTNDIQLPYLRLPILPFSLSSPALGLLLVFKTNTSYQRWLEGRNRWGIIVAHSINIMRMASTFVDDTSSSSTPATLTKEEGDQKSSLNDLSLAVWILSRTIMNTLSGSIEDDKEYENQLLDSCRGNDEDDDDTDNDDDYNSEFVHRLLSCPNSDHRTNAALIEASIALDNIPVDEKRRVEIDKSLVILNDARVACERIFSSPIPLVYTRHTARFLSLWMLLLPFAIHDVFVQADQPGLATIPAAGLLSLFLFGIEELAVQLEEPFSILPMQRYCDEIKQTNQNIIDWSIVSKRSRRKKK